MKKNKTWLLVSVCLLVLVSAILSIGIGRYPISPALTVQMLFDKLLGHDLSEYDSTSLTVLFTLRLPRVTADILVGAGLATAGAVYQAIFQNQLVSSDILGVSNGASVGAALAMVLGWNRLGVQGLAFVFGVGTVCFAVLLASAFHERGNMTLVLSGMIISGLMSSALSFIKFSADVNNTLPEIVYWLMGSMASVTLSDVKSVLIPIVLSHLILFALSWKINIISMGEDEAKLLGVNVLLVKIICIFCSSMLTVCAVCISGVIGWFGLIVPHISRLVIGSDNRKMLPFCTGLGGLLMVILDTVARTALISEIPIGILTGGIGTIFFSVLIVIRRATYET